MSSDAHGSAIQMWTACSVADARSDMLERDRAHVWLLPLSQTSEALEQLASVLLPDEHERAARFHFERDRRRFIAARGRLRQLLGSYAGMPAETVRFQNGAYGKPYLVAGAGQPELQFSLSHSGEWAMAGFARGAELGVDLEQIRPMPDFRDLARDNFAPDEVAAIEGLAPDRQLDGFFACWTRKEAYVKARGLGLSLDLASFIVSVAPERHADFLSQRDGAPGYRVDSFQPLPGFWAATATETDTRSAEGSPERLPRYFTLAT